MQLKNKTALILGIGSQIAQDLALKLAEADCNLLLQYRSNYPDGLAQVLKNYPIQYNFLQADLAQSQGTEKLFAQIGTQNQTLDFLINCIGDFAMQKQGEIPPARFKQIIDSNLNIAYEVCYAALPFLRRAEAGSRILNFGYALASQLEGKPRILPYHIAKLGLILLTKALAKQEITNGILINCLSPSIAENSAFFPEDSLPLGRPIALSEISEAALFLLQSDCLTGVNLEIDGGWRGKL
jgi:NAD(P)-dependent dehydrogenase (short-subunit alcohol dehydrogenase family)